MWGYIEQFASWLKELLLYLPKKWWADLLDALASVIQSLPVPDFVYQAANAFASTPPMVVFFANKFAVPEGIAMMLVALTARFVLRRIPLIG